MKRNVPDKEMQFDALEEKKDHSRGRRSLVSFTYLYLIPPVDQPRLETSRPPRFLHDNMC